MQQQAMNASGGRAASRERRAQLVQGKVGLPPAAERTRTGEREATLTTANSAPAVVVQSTASAAITTPAPQSAAVSSVGRALSGRAASLARRQSLVQGKVGLKQFQSTASAATLPSSVSRDEAGSPGSSMASATTSTAERPLLGAGRSVAQAMRAARARNGRGDTSATRPSARLRDPAPIQYPPKVVDTQTYGGGRVTGVRIGQGRSVTGDEAGAMMQVTGSQYIGRETGLHPREGGVKVGAARTAAGLVVTGTQVRSQVSITGDESNAAIRITGEADQELGDDLLSRREQGAYASMQFARQANPHGASVFGTNLGRSIKSIGSRERNRERALEQTDSGLPISGTAVGRSVRVTGDESGACRTVTGDQYLMPASKQAQCDSVGTERATRPRTAMSAMLGRPDPVTGEKVVESETWNRQRITGVDIEHNRQVTGDEPGACATITGTQYVGPAQYEGSCGAAQVSKAAVRVIPVGTAGGHVTGNTPINASHVTGTQRGGDRAITGTSYYRADTSSSDSDRDLSGINQRFSVRSPQRDAQLRADANASAAPSAENRITGAFAVGAGKITGNKEFHFTPRPRAERDESKSRITGEGRAEGPAITGGAWDANSKVTGTDGYIAAERNPSERGGQPQAFAGASQFKGQGKHDTPTHHVTGMVGWSPKASARVTLSGGAQG